MQHIPARVLPSTLPARLPVSPPASISQHANPNASEISTPMSSVCHLQTARLEGSCWATRDLVLDSRIECGRPVFLSIAPVKRPQPVGNPCLSARMLPNRPESEQRYASAPDGSYEETPRTRRNHRRPLLGFVVSTQCRRLIPWSSVRSIQ